VGSGTSERAKNLTTDEITAITTGGLKIFPIYQDRASDKETYFTAAQGKTDGTTAKIFPITEIIQRVAA
ncbi:glycoside hydrolase domain-containing protein, partial [Liquorilactobacillus hordei]|uniref:glycoside hydrolase domain-containing protein n=1 Tax=Liquorilactobacillus hordei TaxID=468911 RepID=UPI0039EC5672